LCSAAKPDRQWLLACTERRVHLARPTHDFYRTARSILRSHNDLTRLPDPRCGERYPHGPSSTLRGRVISTKVFQPRSCARENVLSLHGENHAREVIDAIEYVPRASSCSRTMLTLMMLTTLWDYPSEERRHVNFSFDMSCRRAADRQVPFASNSFSGISLQTKYSSLLNNL
jgi:hypothetical protein